jgi:hypothetical protein
MKKKWSILCAIPAVIFIINSFACAYNQVIDLGPGCAYSVNDNGMIVGESGGHACLFDSTGGGANINLGTPSGNYSYGRARSVNNSGQIVGSVWNNSATATDSHACIFDKTGGGNNIDLGNGSAMANNNNGQIVGRSSIYNSPCIFDSTGGGANFYPCGNPGPDGIVRSINDSGQMVGNLDNEGFAVLFDPTGSGNNIWLTGYGVSRAYSINNNGQIVGYLHTSSGLRACLFDPTGGGNNIDLGYGTAYSINDSGQIVGSDGMDACLFDSTGGGNNIFLNTLIDPSSGWWLQKAYDINNNGWIVGQGNYYGEDHAFLLIVPEPVSALMFGLGAIFLLSRKKCND